MHGARSAQIFNTECLVMEATLGFLGTTADKPQGEVQRLYSALVQASGVPVRVSR